MLTTSAAICVVGGMLAGIILLASLVVTPAYAKSQAVKSGRTAHHTRSASHLVRQGRKHAQPPRAKGKVVAALRNFSPASRRETGHDQRTRSLGTFAVRAYTHPRRPNGALSKTASGTLPTAGRTVAVDPRVIPLGSKIHIAGVGE
ncbi:MAG TPA: hypothetical protein VGX03_31510, partial [Candidatus Binatia bacterium]|nr:hypothetical protein [Candidatus Binatia bacterium]